MRVRPCARSVGVITSPHEIILYINGSCQNGGPIVNEGKPQVACEIFARVQLQSHLFSKSCTVRRFLWAVLIIDLLYNNPQPSRFKLGAYNFQFGMTVKESGKNHLADNCLYDRLSRVLEKPGPLIRAIQLFKPTSRRTPLKLPGVNDNQQIQIFGGCPNWFVNRIVIGIALD